MGWFLWALCPGQIHKTCWQSAAHTGNDWNRTSAFFSVTERTESCTHCGVLKVVQTVVCEDEPPPLPGFNSSPCGANSQHQRGSGERSERNEHRSTGSSSRQADRCMGRQTNDGSTGLLLPRTSRYFTIAPCAHHHQLHSLQLSGYWLYNYLFIYFYLYIFPLVCANFTSTFK